MAEKEDEEITIDFSKIKNFFKSSKKEEKKVEETTKGPSAKNDEEFNIDFSKIKDFFKSKKQKEANVEQISEHKKEDEIDLSFDLSKIKKFFKPSEEATKDEDISVNWGKAINFFKKYGVIFLALIPIILAIYVRMQSTLLPITDDWATNSVINNIMSQIRAGIDQQYPNLPDANKDALVSTLR